MASSTIKKAIAGSVVAGTITGAGAGIGISQLFPNQQLELMKEEVVVLKEENSKLKQYISELESKLKNAEEAYRSVIRLYNKVKKILDENKSAYNSLYRLYNELYKKCEGALKLADDAQSRAVITENLNRELKEKLEKVTSDSLHKSNEIIVMAEKIIELGEQLRESKLVNLNQAIEREVLNGEIALLEQGVKNLKNKVCVNERYRISVSAKTVSEVVG